jgi:adenylate kinase
METIRVLILGEQGAGKGTLGRRLERSLPATFLSAGDLLRAEAKRNTPRGREVARRLAAYEGVDVGISYGLLEEALRAWDHSTALVLDGYPRMVDQLERLHELIGGLPDHVLVLHVPTVITVGRILSRLTCESCGRTYGPWVPPSGSERCDGCSGLLRHRDDDALPGLRKRQAVWKQHGFSIVREYREAGVVSDIDASRAPAEVCDAALSALGEEKRSKTRG